MILQLQLLIASITGHLEEDRMTTHPCPILTSDTRKRDEFLKLKAYPSRVLQVALLRAKRVTGYGCS